MQCSQSITASSEDVGSNSTVATFATADSLGGNGSAMGLDQRTHEEDIYEDLCYVTLRVGRDLACNSQSFVTAPIEKRDYCIRELVETEKNYVEALNMIIRHFVRPLKKILCPEDRDLMFRHIEELTEIHKGFHAELVKNFPGQISNCFLSWKERFVIYGDYCANLPRAQALIDDLCHRNDLVHQAILRHQQEANDGKFKLRDLLSLPMQRVLKYHLLLKELIKNTPEIHEDYRGLQKAHEAMIDIGDYINEVKRDSEALQIIADIQASIVDLDMPENMDLKDYGRLLKDGEVKIKFNDESKIKLRHIFIFDKVMLLCKSIKSDQYNFKGALILSDYEIQDPKTMPSVATNGSGNVNSGSSTLRQPFKDKWCHYWFLVHIQERYSYTMYVKSEEYKRKWIDAFERARDNEAAGTEAVRSGRTDHLFAMSTFSRPTVCANCDKLLRGIFFQGYRCSICGITVHKSCITQVRSCGRPSLPPKPPFPPSSPSLISTCSNDEESSRSSCNDLMTPSRRGLDFARQPTQEIDKVRAVMPFNGRSSLGQLSFDVDDVILVTNKKPDTELDGSWIEGRHLRTGKEGLFPSDRVDNVDASSSLRDNNTFSLIDFDRSAYVNLNLNEYPWFAGTMDRASAQMLLEKLPSTTFLVRISPKQKGNYAISLNCNGTVKHMRIFVSPDHRYYLASKYFDSVVELVRWYEERSLSECFKGLNFTLTIPYKKLFESSPEPIGYAIAIYSYNDNSPNFLSLRKGDRVAILSKAGEERGWWKGQIEHRIGYFPLAYVIEIKDF